MKVTSSQADPTATQHLRSWVRPRLWGFFYALVFGNFLFDDYERGRPWGVVTFGSTLLFFAAVASIIRPGWSLRLALWTIGKIDYYEIYDPAFQQRMRTRHKSAIDQLTRMNFSTVFFEGESTSAFRLFFIFPAIIKAHMLLDGAVIRLGEGARLTNGSPILASSDNSAFACVSSLGVKFRTAFEDGTILESKTYDDDGSITGSKVVRHCFKGESIAHTWEQHRKWIQLLESVTNTVIPDLSFDAWVRLIRTVSADMRQHN